MDHKAETTIDNLPVELVSAIVHVLGWRWRSYVRPVCHLWRDICDGLARDKDDADAMGWGPRRFCAWTAESMRRASRGLYMCASSAAYQIGAQGITNPQDAVALCVTAPGATAVDAAVVMVASGVPRLVDHVVTQSFELDHDRPLGTACPLENLTRLVITRCSAADVDHYLDANPRADVWIVPALARDDPSVVLSLLLGRHCARVCNIPPRLIWQCIGEHVAARTLVALLARLDSGDDTDATKRLTGGFPDYMLCCAKYAARGARTDVLDVVFSQRVGSRHHTPVWPDVYLFLAWAQHGGPATLRHMIAEARRQDNTALIDPLRVARDMQCVGPRLVGPVLEWLWTESGLFGDSCRAADQVAALAQSTLATHDPTAAVRIMKHYAREPVAVESVVSLVAGALNHAWTHADGSRKHIPVLDVMVSALDQWDRTMEGALRSSIDLPTVAGNGSAECMQKISPPRTGPLAGCFCRYCVLSHHVASCRSTRCSLAVLWDRWWPA
ncbi:hypothetical protein psal_cds_1057 [Pandoravirus salinus]|uniref:F-box incomplete domain containing protein n=1 Tax=Pandoravirus salinus TaxID=1349410 RepID=S4W0E6_9VIRU|nr:hypothetical protein psal_cds_1057 [Pandoravirus salinus]AGO85261.1 hypothetical protein psal_cds_1057 [Pandoravirus salinus]